MPLSVFTYVLSSCRFLPETAPVGRAEQMAFELLQGGSADITQLAQLVELLPVQPTPKRRKAITNAYADGLCFTAGLYTFASMSGLATKTSQFPWIASLLGSIVRGAAPHLQFTTISLHRNLLMQPHVDSGNQPGSRSIVIPCGRWQAGGLWNIQYQNQAI